MLTLPGKNVDFCLSVTLLSDKGVLPQFRNKAGFYIAL